MRPLGVVTREPVRRLSAHPGERAEDAGGEDFPPIASDEALDVGILVGLARLDLPESDAVARHQPLKPSAISSGRLSHRRLCEAPSRSTEGPGTPSTVT
jgi:hypothetical protein